MVCNSLVGPESAKSCQPPRHEPFLHIPLYRGESTVKCLGQFKVPPNPGPGAKDCDQNARADRPDIREGGFVSFRTVIYAGAYQITQLNREGLCLLHRYHEAAKGHDRAQKKTQVLIRPEFLKTRLCECCGVDNRVHGGKILLKRLKDALQGPERRKLVRDQRRVVFVQRVK